MPFPGIGSISAIIHMLAKGPKAARSNHLMRVIGTVILALLVSLSLVGSVSAQDSPLLLSSINLSSASVTEGRSVEATVTLNMAAPNTGAKVSLAVDPAGSVDVVDRDLGAVDVENRWYFLVDGRAAWPP